MAPDDPSGARPGPVVLRIKLRYDDVEAMIERFAPNVGKTGLFLPTKSIQPIGAELKFELRLSNDQPVLVGLGRVKAVRAPDAENPKATFGMAIELMRVTRESRDLILKMLEQRKQLGLPDTKIPMPGDIDAARRADFVDTGVRDYASGAVPMVVPAIDSSPLPSESLMTAPRRQTGPMAVAKIAAVEPLAPEPPRKRRVPVAELIASASGPIVASFTTDGLDEDIDVAAVLARARALAGSDLDSELEALRDSAAAPVAIDIEAASAELARQLGGAAVRRDRSARWAPPPATTTEPNGHAEPVAPEPAPTEIEAKAEEIVAPEPAATEIDRIDTRDAFGRDVAEEPEVDEPETQDDDQATPVAEPAFESKRAPTDGLIHDDADASQFEDAHEVAPEQIDDEIHRLDEGDFEEVEHTQIGAPVEELGLADRLDAQLDEAEREDLGFSETVDAGVAGYRNDGGGFALEEPPAAGDYVIPMHAHHDPGFEAALTAAVDEEEEIEEIDDFEILAEADAEDADLLAAAAEQEVAAHAEPQFELPPARPSFLSRLELDEDSGYRMPAPEPEPAYGRFDEFSHEPGELDPRILSAGHALRAFEDPEEHSDFNSPGTFTPVPSAAIGEASYTFAGDLSADDFDAPHGNYAAGNSSGAFVPPDAFDQSDVIAIGPTTPEQRSEDFPDLENALAALDVDLDDLGGIGPPGARKRRNANARGVRGARPESVDDIPTARGGGQGNIGSSPTEHAPTRRTPEPKSGRVHKRATTEDGILIDFDDDD
jgi:hypothetical protein